MNYCSACGHKVVFGIPEGDNRERFHCEHCRTIHYQNPRVVTGCLPIWEDKILLCRRAIEPRSGYWTLPAGFLENGETAREGAIRETWEEARAQVAAADLYTIFSLPHISQIYLFYRAALEVPDFAVGEESLEVAFFEERDIPWTDLAFPVVRTTLEYYFADRAKSVYPVRSEEIRFPLGHRRS
jgi:ADP-ribose pyrophosphatase YjhB (NUDIX family)